MAFIALILSLSTFHARFSERGLDLPSYTVEICAVGFPCLPTATAELKTAFFAGDLVVLTDIGDGNRG